MYLIMGVGNSSFHFFRNVIENVPDRPIHAYLMREWACPGYCFADNEVFHFRKPFETLIDVLHTLRIACFIEGKTILTRLIGAMIKQWRNGQLLYGLKQVRFNIFFGRKVVKVFKTVSHFQMVLLFQCES